MAGFFDGLQQSMMSPLFLGGAALMGGEGIGGAIRGAGAGMGFQDHQRQLAEQQAQKEQYNALLSKSSGSLPQEFMPLLGAMSPSQGLDYIAKYKQKQYTKPTPTDDQREYDLAKTQGFKGTFWDYLTGLKQAGASRTNINMPMESAYDKEIGGLLAKEFVDAQKAGSKADQDIADLEVTRKAMSDPNVYMGTGGNQVQALKKTAQTVFGLDIQGVPEGELIQKMSAKSALAMKDQLPGPMSDSDRKFLIDLPANLTTSPEGARRVVTLGIEQKRWQSERASVARRFAAQNGGRLTPQVYSLLADVDKKYASSMARIADELRTQAQANPRAPTAGTPLQELRNKYKGLE